MVVYVYISGASVYELALGRELGATNDEGSVRSDKPLDDCFLYGVYSQPLVQTVLSMLQKDPSARPTTAHITQRAREVLVASGYCSE